MHCRCNNPPRRAGVTRPADRATEEKNSRTGIEEPPKSDWLRAAGEAKDELTSAARIVWGLVLHTTRSQSGRRDRSS